MTRFGLRSALVATAVAITIGACGCTNSDPLAPLPGELQVFVEVTSPGAAGYDSFIMLIQQLGFHSTLPGADEALGPDPISAFQAPVGVNFAVGELAQVGSLSLSAGQYQLTSVEINYSRLPQMFIKSTPVEPIDPCNASNCLDYVVFRTGTPIDPNDPDSPRFNGFLPPPPPEVTLVDPAVDISDFPGSPIFPILPGSGGQITVRFDGSALAQLFRDAFSCSCVQNCGPNNTIPPPCVSAYVEPTASQILPYVTIVQ